LLERVKKRALSFDDIDVVSEVVPCSEVAFCYDQRSFNAWVKKRRDVFSEVSKGR
jgi:hypothetical protein